MRIEAVIAVVAASVFGYWLSGSIQGHSAVELWRPAHVGIDHIRVATFRGPGESHGYNWKNCTDFADIVNARLKADGLIAEEWWYCK